MATPQDQYFTSSTELADLGSARFDHDTAAIGDRDFSLRTTHTPVSVPTGRAPKGLEGQVFAWNTFQYTTAERDEKEEKKGDLHEGQLHRANRAAAGVVRPPVGGFGGGGKGVKAKAKEGVTADALCAGRKPEGVVVAPLAKGFAEELDKGMFWDEKIC